MHQNHLFYSGLFQHFFNVWALLISFDSRDDTFLSPSMPIVVVIITSLIIIFGMDLFCFHLKGLDYLNLVIDIFCPWFPLYSLISQPYFWNGVFCFIMVYLEVIFFVYYIVVAGTLGVNAFAKWIHVLCK